MKHSFLPLAPAACLVLLTGLFACGDSGEGGSGNGTNTGANGGSGGAGAGQTDGGNGADGGAGAGTLDTMDIMSDGGGGSGGGGPQPCPSENTNVPVGDCDLYLQNCPSSTDTCEIGDSDPENDVFDPITTCITKNGLKNIGESCNDTNDCAMHLTCVGNLCTPFCCPEDPNSCGGGTCNVNVNLVNDDGSMTGFHFQACDFGQSCDLFTPESCPTNENCYLANPGLSSCYTPTLPEGQELAEGAPCEAINDCKDSSSCVQEMENGPFVCRYFCLINSNNPPGLGGCPAGQLCDQNAFETGIANVGICHP